MGTMVPTHPCSMAAQSIPHPQKGRMHPSHGINTETGLRKGLLFPMLPSQPRCQHSSFHPAGRMAAHRHWVWHRCALCEMRLRAQWMNSSAMFHPRYTGKHELSQRPLPTAPCPKCSRNRGISQASPEASEDRRKPQLPLSFPPLQART